MVSVFSLFLPSHIAIAMDDYYLFKIANYAMKGTNKTTCKKKQFYSSFHNTHIINLNMI
ncbi:hypothetical protein Hanom_Chr09g00871441 [Helianthus anomalus]